MTVSGTSASVITVRPIETVAEYRACQEIQRKAWGIAEDGYVVPVATMISVQHAGGLVLGAFDSDRLAGFAFGYLGRVRGQWALYSQLAGVDPAIQSSGIGAKLKHAQRAWAREQGLALVAWSYDPLQAGNANFNLHRLGATSRTYMVNYFGERTDALNVGLDTDRLVVEWPVEGEERGTRTPAKAEGRDAERGARGDEASVPLAMTLIEAESVGGGMRRPVAVHASAADLSGGHSELTLEIPADIAALKAADPKLARSWQLAVREAFLAAFAAGYVAVDFIREKEGDTPRAYYVLRLPGPNVPAGAA